MPISFDNTYAKLPARFYEVLKPTSVADPSLVRVNHSLAKFLGIDPVWLESPEGIEVLAGNGVPDGAAPISQAYAGHQFANFVPQLGDGRAILLGEVIATNGQRYDIQLKGSGPTPWSRRGDGRSALGPVLREYIVSEAMYALGVPTTRALAAVTSGEKVARQEIQAGGVFTRVAASHLRVGTFQYFASRGDHEAVRILSDFAMERHYPEAAEAESPYIALLDAVIAAQARLIPQWLGLGFIHGVMNTDNCAISGETIDYGPCAFMEEFHPQCVYSSIDRLGRYAWGNQPPIALWNLSRFAETLLPLIDDDREAAISQAEESLKGFGRAFESGYVDTFAAKLGLARHNEHTEGFIDTTLKKIAEQEVDFTLFFRRLTQVADGEDPAAFVELWHDESEARSWLEDWTKLAKPEGEISKMQKANPILIPRNHQVERAIQAGYEGDFSPFHRLVDALAEPYMERSEYSDLEAPARPEERVTETFCGT